MSHSLSVELTPRQRELISHGLRILVVGIGGGVMVCFADFTALLHIFDAPVLLLLFFGMGILVGMMSVEIHHAIFSALLSMLLGSMFFLSWLVFPAQLVIAHPMGGVMLVMGLVSLATVLHLQLIGVLLGGILGQFFGPEW